MGVEGLTIPVSSPLPLLLGYFLTCWEDRYDQDGRYVPRSGGGYEDNDGRYPPLVPGPGSRYAPPSPYGLSSGMPEPLADVNAYEDGGGRGYPRRRGTLPDEAYYENDRERERERGDGLISQRFGGGRTPNYPYSNLPEDSYDRERERDRDLRERERDRERRNPYSYTLPDSWSRTPGRMSSSYGYFEPKLVTHMDDILVEIPVMPSVLVGFDITGYDWDLFVQVRLPPPPPSPFPSRSTSCYFERRANASQDLIRAWSGQPNQYGQVHRRSTMAASVIDTWNSTFFLLRQIEMVLVRGRIRYTGPTAGQVDPRLARAVEDAAYDEDDDDSTPSEGEYEYDSRDRDRDRDRESERRRYGYADGYGLYGNNFHGEKYAWMTDAATARNAWMERRRGSRSSRSRRSQRSRDDKLRRRYSLYVMSVR